MANIYLYEVLDKWFEQEVKPCLSGQALLVRYVDDCVIVFSSEKDARRVMAVLPKRFGRFGLRLHLEKTRRVPFKRPGCRGSGTFDFLGFTHYLGKSLKGNWVVKRKTSKGRFSRALKRMTQWCRENRHMPVSDKHEHLVRKLKGHYQYYGITGNSRAISRFHFAVRRIWRKWLDRRSQRARMNWERFSRLLARYPLPQPIAVHSILCRAARS